jgi:hypothetical protein
VLGLWHTLQDLPRVLKRGGKGEPAWP